jgi:SAM-dependent methyltransferase
VEGFGPATYGDRIADVYDAWYGTRLDPAEAVDFLADLAGGGRALELGIGTGRVALPLAARGVDVSGIDASEAMVAKLRAKPAGDRLAVTVGDFVDAPVDGTFSLVYVAFATFFALTTQDDQVRCMQSVARLLDDGGHFVLEAFVPDPGRFTNGQSTTTLHTGLDHVLLDAVRHDPVNQTIEGHHVLVTEGTTVLYPLRLRYCWPAELDVMARIAGMSLELRFAGYDRSRFDGRSTRHVSVYRRDRR